MSKVTSKDLQIAFLLSGVEGVSKLIADSANPVKVLDSTLDSLFEAGKTEDELACLVTLRETFAGARKSRGKLPLAIGDRRDFKVQSVNIKNKSGQVVNTSLFLRVPVELLNVTKGDSLTVQVKQSKTGAPYIVIE